ncbi:TPA: ATP-binding protein, partial [Escherichia coli]|nr:ATP-binding protein [Escherichia coli]
MNTTKLDEQLVDITPTPKILRTLGDIPFAVWQCLAELTDNSLDAFADAEYRGLLIESPRIDIYWSTESVATNEREIVVQDNGNGMPLNVLQSAAKAGYSSNDPIHNLGLFGMGFNISTARLGDETIFLSATPDSKEWVGIRINFDQLIKAQSFTAPVIRVPKKNDSESGTKIIIRNLK